VQQSIGPSSFTVITAWCFRCLGCFEYNTLKRMKGCAAGSELRGEIERVALALLSRKFVMMQHVC
jgi:hypothetical protein